MKQTGKRTNFLLLSFAAIVLAAFSSAAFAQDAKIDLKPNNGSILIYKASAAGYSNGQRLHVIRGGAVVGTVEIIIMTNSYAQARIISGGETIHEQDHVAPATEYQRVSSVKDPIYVATKRKLSPQSEEPAEPLAGTDGNEQEKTEIEPAEADPVEPEETLLAYDESETETQYEEQEVEETTSPVRRSQRGFRETSFTEKSLVADERRVIQQDAPVVGKTSPFVIHIGYIFFEQDFTGATINNDPSPMVAIDYRQRKTKATNIVYNLMYTMHDGDYSVGGQQLMSNLEAIQFSANFIWTDFKSNESGGRTGFYRGIGAGYRSVSVDPNYTGASGGIYESKTLADIDFHGIIGNQFRRNIELKLDYSFAEDYLGVTFGIGGKTKKAPPPVIEVIEPEPEPEIVVEVGPEPEPVIEEEPEPEPEPEEKIVHMPETIFERQPPPRVPEPLIVRVAEPRVERKVYDYVAMPTYVEKEVYLVLEDVHFAFDSSTLTPQAWAILNKNLKITNSNPNARILIAGYTSASGTNAYNQKMRERRANAVKAYLTKASVTNPERLSVIGYGEKFPAMYEKSPSTLFTKAAKANQRVLFEVIVK